MSTFTKPMPIDLLDRTNYRENMGWYQKGFFTAWYDRSIKFWTVTERDSTYGNSNQVGDAQYYQNRDQYRECAKRLRG